MRRLKRMIDEDWDPPGEHKDAFKRLYLTERDACLPDDFLGEDLMEDIISLFYYPLSSVRDELEERTGIKEFIPVIVQPSYMDTSYAAMICEDKALLTVSAKAWNFFWTDEDEMAKDLEDWYRSAELRLIGGLRLHGDKAWALRILLQQVIERDIPRLEEDSPSRSNELRLAADFLADLVAEDRIVENLCR